MAISTYKTYLMHGTGTGTAYTKLVDITSFPDLGGEPEAIDVTTLSDRMKKFIPGIQENSAMPFEANYTKEDYAKVKALEGTEQKLAVWFGATTADNVDTPTGDDGKFSFPGYVTVRIVGAGVNEAVKMTITVIPSGPITEE